MTTEDDFQRTLDATPEDWQTRMVFADWLDERGDPRAAGYRALGKLTRRAMFCQMYSPDPVSKPGKTFFIFGNGKIRGQNVRAQWTECFLPLEWYKLLPVAPESPAPQSDYWK